MELSGPGVQYISDNQLYNSIITAHAILMSAPLCGEKRAILSESTEGYSRVKGYKAGRAKLYGETQTAKLIVKGVNGTSVRVPGYTPDLFCATFRLTNLIRNLLQNRNSTE